MASKALVPTIMALKICLLLLMTLCNFLVSYFRYSTQENVL